MIFMDRKSKKRAHRDEFSNLNQIRRYEHLHVVGRRRRVGHNNKGGGKFGSLKPELGHLNKFNFGNL